MERSQQRIAADLEAEAGIMVHIRESGRPYAAWYVGIAKDPRERLFQGHGVDEARDWWIFRQASSSETAREIERYFVTVLGTDGGPGGGDSESVFVYAYLKSEHTRP